MIVAVKSKQISLITLLMLILEGILGLRRIQQVIYLNIDYITHTFLIFGQKLRGSFNL